MPWPDQNPPATDVLLHLNVPCSGGGSPAYLKIDKLPDGRYRLLTLPERSVTTAPRLAATETNAKLHQLGLEETLTGQRLLGGPGKSLPSPCFARSGS